MTDLEIMPHYLVGKRIRRVSWTEGKWIQLQGYDCMLESGEAYPTFYFFIHQDDWEFYVEPKKKVKHAHALCRCSSPSKYYLSEYLYSSESRAKEAIGENFVRWPANPDTYLEVEE